MAKQYNLRLRSKKILLIADKLLLLKAMRRLHGRFWGVAAMLGFTTGMTICFLIKPELLVRTTAFSNFGEDVRTAPFFVGAIFFSAYGLWRWRNYLARTFKKGYAINTLITFTIIGLYLVALMPVTVKGWVQTTHYVGFAIAGVSMAATVFTDILLRKTRRTKKRRTWQLVRVFALFLIIEGLVITAMSASKFDILDESLLGETLLFLGYGVWVIAKTYQGDGAKTKLSKVLNKVVIVE